MCGICGFLGNPTGIDRTAMLHAIRHRGPDDEGMFNDCFPGGELWFGHRRLAILDLSPTGHQPMSTTDGRLTITFNGEIYNYQDIRAELTHHGHQFNSKSDTEVILQAWYRWGPAALSHFRGMFAFALWDRTERCLWLARDRMGEKPLYYVQHPGRILFASEIRCLLASGVVERRMDSDGLDSYLAFGSVADPFTMVSNVRAVEAGCWIQFREGCLVSRRYWSLADIPEATEDCSRKEHVETTAALIRQSCSLCMVADVPVAVLLSGGIDSSSIVTVLTEAGFTALDTFNVVFEEPDIEYSEERWASLVANRFGTRHKRIIVSERNGIKWNAECLQSMDSPSYDGANTYLVCRAISAAGNKVALSGQGSDELFLGYNQRHMFPFLWHLARLQLGQFGGFLNALFGRVAEIVDTRYEKIMQLLTEPDAAAAYVAVHSVFSHKGIERLRGERRPSPSRFVSFQGGSTALGILSRLELTHYLRNTLLRDGDQMSMAHSLELRQPFLDCRLVESVVALPSTMKVQPRNRQKPLLVDAIGPCLPIEVVERKKQGFTLPYNRWLRNSLSPFSPIGADVGLDPDAVKAVCKRFAAGQDSPRYWTLAVLAAWAKQHKISSP